MDIELRSSLSIEDCKQKLLALLGKGENKSGRIFLGWLRDRKFSFRLTKGLRNPFVPYFQGSLEPVGESTIIKGEFRLRTGAKWGMIIWCIFWILSTCLWPAVVGMTLLGFVGLIGVENLKAAGEELYQTILIFPLMGLSFPVMGVFFGVGFPVLFTILRLKDRERIIKILKKSLDANESYTA
jgi:hypothetical protein